MKVGPLDGVLYVGVALLHADFRSAAALGETFFLRTSRRMDHLPHHRDEVHCICTYPTTGAICVMSTQIHFLTCFAHL